MEVHNLYYLIDAIVVITQRRVETDVKFKTGNLQGADGLEDPSVYGKILKCILKRWS